MTETLAEPRARTSRGVRTIRVALAGCGVVGGELVRLLRGSEAEVRARHGVRFELVRVLVRGADRPRPHELPPGVLTTDLAAFLATDAELVVEAIGGLDPAVRIAEAALAAGRRLVTANKAVIAAHGARLAALARRSGGRLDFESAVGGGIPVVRALRDSLALTEIRSVRGILNGTTNFILTRLGDGSSYASALAEAQARGFAEADPARDVSGEDAADKIRILAWLAFGVTPATLPVRRRGIVPHPDRLARDAALLGGVPRLVAEAARTEGGIVAAVEPTVVAVASELGRTRDEENAVRVESRWNGVVRLAGPGAGGPSTASALLGDMLRSTRRTPRDGALRVRGIADRRAHRWAVSAAGVGEPYARGVLERAGIEVERVEHARTRYHLFVTAPAPWERVALATHALEVSGCAPVVSRLELAVD
jgi:homoserine dehydrogenase